MGHTLENWQKHCVVGTGRDALILFKQPRRALALFVVKVFLLTFSNAGCLSATHFNINCMSILVINVNAALFNNTINH
jgi:hypothetical protein